MEDLYCNLSEQEFSKGRKILLWVFGTVFIIIGLWDLYLKVFHLDDYANLGLSITALTIGGFVYFLAFLAASKKELYFKVDSSQISYRFGLVSPKSRNISWIDIKTMYFPKKQKSAFIELNTGKIIHLNLTWIEKKKSKVIRKHIYAVAKSKNIELLKTHPKKS